MSLRVSHRKLCIVTLLAVVAAWVAVTALAGCSQSETVTEVPVARQVALGANAYMTSCASCHGQRLQGVPRMGVALRDTPFMQHQSADVLAEVIMLGRAADGPHSQTGQPMPPRGGNPNLTDEDIDNIVVFLRHN